MNKHSNKMSCQDKSHYHFSSRTAWNDSDLCKHWQEGSALCGTSECLTQEYVFSLYHGAREDPEAWFGDEVLCLAHQCRHNVPLSSSLTPCGKLGQQKVRPSWSKDVLFTGTQNKWYKSKTTFSPDAAFWISRVTDVGRHCISKQISSYVILLTGMLLMVVISSPTAILPIDPWCNERFEGIINTHQKPCHRGKDCREAINSLWATSPTSRHCRAQVPLLSVCQHINKEQTVPLPGGELKINLKQEGQKSCWFLWEMSIRMEDIALLVKWNGMDQP